MSDHTRVLERFWPKVDKTDTCWLWTASKMTGGYGAFYSGGITDDRCAHRFAYTVLVGPIPAGTELDHLCFIKHCVNPDHLEPVSKAENQHRRNGPNRNGTSGYRGVTWSTQQQRWVVQAYLGGKHQYGGSFLTVEEADRAAVALRARLYQTN